MTSVWVGESGLSKEGRKEKGIGTKRDGVKNGNGESVC